MFFRDVRSRGQISAAELQAAGEAIAKGQFAFQSQGDNAPMTGSYGSIVNPDLAVWFFAKITHVVIGDPDVYGGASVAGERQYGFIEQVLKPDGTFIDQSEPIKCDGQKNWAYTQDGTTLAVGDYVVMRRSSYNPDLFEVLFAGGGGDIMVCGTPMQRRLTVLDDTECPECDVTTADIETYEEVDGIYFDKCLFKVTATNECGGSGADAANAAASGSGPTTAPAVKIETQGATGSRPVPYDVIFCPDTCENVIQWSYDCYDRGIYLGYWVDVAPECPTP